MVGLRLLNSLQRRLQVGPRIERGLAEIVKRLQCIGEIEGTIHIELLHRRAVVE